MSYAAVFFSLIAILVGAVALVQIRELADHLEDSVSGLRVRAGRLPSSEEATQAHFRAPPKATAGPSGHSFRGHGHHTHPPKGSA